MFNYQSKIKGLAVGISTVLCVAALLPPAHSSLEKTVLTLADYPEFFRQCVPLVFWENSCQVALQNTSGMAARLTEQTGNELILKRDVEVLAKDKTGCNLILFGISDSKNVFSEVCEIADALKVIAKYPCKYKGILEILASPWSKNKAVLIIDRIDQWKVKTAVVVLTGSQELNANKLKVNCAKGRKSMSPYHSKIDATLSLLLTLRGKEKVPHELKDIVMRKTVGVSIRFTHELNADEVKSIEALGLKFARLPKGEIAHTGTIYGADILWDKVDDLIELHSVVRVESAWQPGLENPGS